MKDINEIGIVGLGIMGSSIATCLLAQGYKVTCLIQDLSTTQQAKDRILGNLKQLHHEALILVDPNRVLSNLFVTDDIKNLGHHEIIIESIVENLEAKKRVYSQLEKVLSSNAIIGSNTSGIPVSILQEGMVHPERLIGIHWAEPAHVTRFMEVICGKNSSLKFAKKVIELASNWGKEPTLVKRDIRGFISNRLMYAMMREAFYLVEKKYATYEDIDRACRNDLGAWITLAGPFRFMDLTGIPAYLSVMKDLFPELSNSNVAPDFIEKLVSSGARGVSNAHGFYQYTDKSADRWEKKFHKFSYDIRKLSEKYSTDQDS
ncbi:MAG: 3-hydroxybutyryl-CoA dehydrogenase [Cyclobacteriaceae bacterium]|nr:MAG: 3-hydroxybutyryl-CoA dehydrogenase [Cyclobacteriaceae bacterium]